MNRAELLKSVLKGLGGATVGGATGYYVTPKVLGFEHHEPSRNMSAILDSLLGLGIAVDPKVRALGPGRLSGLWAGGQLLPAGYERINRPAPPTATEQASSLLSSPTAKGLGMGAAAAGLGGLATGLMRAKSDPDQSRAGMVTSDALKYLIPALIAGGTIGSLKE